MKKYKYIIKKEIKRNPMRFIDKMIIFDFNTPLSLYDFNIASSFDELLSILEKQKLQSIKLSNLNELETNQILKQIKDYIEYIEIFDCEFNYLLLEEINELKTFSGAYLKSLTRLWDLSKNPHIEDLSLLCCENIIDISGLKDSSLKSVEFKKDFAFNPSCLPIRNLDLNVFSTLKYLKSLILHILKSDDREKDLLAFSKLTNLEVLNLAKNHFTFKEFAYLKSKLNDTKGIDCVYHLGKDPSNEKVYAIIIGEDKPDLIYLEDEDIQKYQDEYSALIDLYKNQ